MAVSVVADMHRRDESRASRLMRRLAMAPHEVNSNDGWPEFSNYPKVRSMFLQAPQPLKKEPASRAHVYALTKTVFDAVDSLAGEIEKLKRSLTRREP
jgi:hypothetical protein